jgi:carbonic anhydrase
MSIIDLALKANRDYAKRYQPKLGQRPAPKIAVVTCIDPRLSNLPEILGLPHADIDVIRTGGPAVTDEVLGELVVSNRILGTTEIMILNDSSCEFIAFSDDEWNPRPSITANDALPDSRCLFSYRDSEENTREQVKIVRSHPWIAEDVPVRGFVLDSETGLLSEVQAASRQCAD